MMALFYAFLFLISNYFIQIAYAGEHSLNFKKLDIKNYEHKFRYKGYLSDCYEYFDNNGKNIIIFSQSGLKLKANHKRNYRDKDSNDDKIPEKSAEIFVYHFIDRGSYPELVTKTYDFVQNCPFDLYIGFEKNSFQITDLNNNNIFEFSFSYKLSCRSDVTPSILKFIMYEMKNKYTVRGETRIIIDKNTNESIGGSLIVDKKLSESSKKFINFAISQWNKYVDEKNFDQL